MIINLYLIVHLIYSEHLYMRKCKSKVKEQNYKVNYYVNERKEYYYENSFEEELRAVAPNIEFNKLSDNFGIIYPSNYNTNIIKTILTLPSVRGIESLTRVALLGEITRGTEGGVNANEELGVNFFKNNPNIQLTGRRIAIAIAGSGIDYLHPDFINADGTSKILYLWDQTKEGNPPEGYYIGTEYTREQINQAIANNDRTLSTDEEGYGTILSGICAG